jgi:hypothetical protein
MTQQFKMLANTPPYADADVPPCHNRDREVQELLKLLVEAVLTLPESEKRSVFEKAITPLFEALLTLNEVKQVPGIGLIWMTLICAGYRDHARRLWPPRTTLSKEPASVAPTPSELKENPDVA